MADDNVVDLEQWKMAKAAEAAFQLIESTPMPLGTMLMSEETLLSFEEEFPGFMGLAERVVEPEGEYWKVNLTGETSKS